MSSVPRVTVVVSAYNLARFLPAGLDSALAQDWPADALEIVVVDDGSTDETPQVLARYAGRITTVRQPNAGLVAAVDRGLAEATGDYIALLDADDEWPADRVRRQVEFLQANPAVGLVHGDMEVIDADGAVITPSFFADRGYQPTSGRVLGRLLAGNFISGGASMFRAALLPALLPIPTDAAYPDWWLAANVAAIAEIAHLPGVFNRYRFHGANMGLGASPERIDVTLAQEIPWRRWMLRHLVDDATVTSHDLLAAFRSWEHGLLRATASARGGARALAPVDADQRERAGRLAAEGAGALRAGAAGAAVRLLLQALAEDPWDGAARFDLEAALRAVGEAEAAASAPAAAVSALPVRGRVTLAWAAELVADPSLLRGYGAAVDGADDATLLVLTRDDAEVEPLVALVEALGLDGPDAADILAESEPATRPAQLWLAARAEGVLGAAPEGWTLPAVSLGATAQG
ncbi:MAG TPA: glycosyltransferase [Baekduia sp.]|uniref:glycosyltransferase n=1 Tax=Baekduia sp. TaxID=2600305 RepID=UPI002CB252C6|nr:glycosyltransferase [Baekduia sp.]HMJ33100.1 glycosyltransferase [Baekduia sp.]